jgi:predicted metal-dependent hydrolase
MMRHLMEPSQSAQLSLFDNVQRREPFSVRISVRARRLSVRVYAGGHVEVIVPPGTRGRSVRDFVGRHRRWIDLKVAQLTAATSPVEAPDVLPSQVRCTAIGETFAIDWRRAERTRLRQIDSRLHIESTDVAGARTVLRRWLVEMAQSRLEPWLHNVAAQVEIDFTRATVRRQKTRWGSCSVRGHISLNCCLLFQNADVVRYLFVHELAHMHHSNHSPAFWRHVERLEPQYRVLDRQLLAGWANVPSWVFQP